MGKIIDFDLSKARRDLRLLRNGESLEIIERYISERIADPAVRNAHNVQIMRAYLLILLCCQEVEENEKENLMKDADRRLKETLDPGEIVHNVKTVFLVKRCLSEWGINITLGVSFG